MRHIALLPISLLLLAVVLLGGAQTTHLNRLQPAFAAYASTDVATATDPLAVCFAPGTPESYMREWEERIHGSRNLDFQLNNRWSNTATDGNTGGQGDRITITYSFVPDGVTIDGGPSRLFSRMNQLFGNQQTWQTKFAQVFAEWNAVCGINYVQVSDDGAAFGPPSPGILGVRGDVRIGSVSIDGPSGVLAYDYYPNIGDMVLDADENWTSSGQNYIFFRNIVAHEHGHGWGLAHVCPANGTKLLEPYYSSSYDGPQHDDIRAAQRNYGDPYEPSDDANDPVRLGVFGINRTINRISIDDNSDIDYYRFSIPAGFGFTLSLIPDGREYLDGPQNGDGSCTAGTLINSGDDQDLNLALYDWQGDAQLAVSNTHPAGQIERIYRYMVPVQGDSFLIEVTGGSANVMQLYKLEFEIFNLSDPYLTSCPMDFDTTALGVPVTLITNLRNGTGNPLQVTSISTTGEFSVMPNTPQTVPPNSDLAMNVTYLATALGLQTGTLNISHNGPGGSVSCDLSGTAVNSSLVFVNGTNVDFGDVPVNHTDSVAVVLRAQGNIPLTLQAITTSAPFSMQFSAITLNPGQTLIIRPRFTPTALTSYDGALVINHTAASSPDTVLLHGVGVPDLNVNGNGFQPLAFRLEQNYPNPFNPTTRIAFELARSGNVRLEIYDLQGRLVSELVNGTLDAGHHFVEFDGSSLATGVYLYRLATPEFSDLRKMMLLK
jgi:hypothetical protein